MSCAIPAYPRGPVRKRQGGASIVLLSPRISPEFQFRAAVALVKPQFKHTVMHRDGRQVWPRHGRRVVAELLAGRRRFRFAPRVTIRGAKDELLRIEFDPSDKTPARSLAVNLSRRLATLWFVLDGRLLHAGRFYRRQGRYRLVPASMRVPRLPREVFLELRSML